MNSMPHRAVEGAPQDVTSATREEIVLIFAKVVTSTFATNVCDENERRQPMFVSLFCRQQSLRCSIYKRITKKSCVMPFALFLSTLQLQGKEEKKRNKSKIKAMHINENNN